MSAIGKAPVIKPGSTTGQSEHPYPAHIENRRARRATTPFRVVAFNALGGISFPGIVKCLRSEPMASASLILLSETDFQVRRSNERRVAAELGELLGMSVAYVPEFGFVTGSGDIRAYIGNAILSAYPLEEVTIIPLPAPIKRHFRHIDPLKAVGGPAALTAVIQVGHERLRVCVAHLDSRSSPAGRALQIESLMASLPATGRTILGGDFNTTTSALGAPGGMAKVPLQMLLRPRRFRWPQRYEPLFERLHAAGFETRDVNVAGRGTFTFSRIVPPVMRPRLDWIALREIEPVAGSPAVIPARTSILSPRVSDHDFIMVDVHV